MAVLLEVVEVDTERAIPARTSGVWGACVVAASPCTAAASVVSCLSWQVQGYEAPFHLFMSLHVIVTP